MKKTLIALAAAGVMLAGNPAFADEASVVYRDLDLSTAEGQKTLDARIDRAARKICGTGDAATGTRLPSRDAARCVADVKAQTKKSLAGILADKQRGG